MKVYLCRHGQTNYNEAGLCNGDPSVDVYLTETGVPQATALAEKLKDKKIDHIIVSELKRTKQTAEFINKYHNVEISIDSRLNDNRSGYENEPVADYYAALDAAENRWEVRFNDGESISDVKDRVEQFIEDLKSRNFEEIVVVTSMMIIQLFIAVLDGLSYEDAWLIKVDRGSCREIDI